LTAERESRPLALVTGAAHRLGRAIAIELAKNGYAIGLHYHRSVKAAAVTAKEIESLGVPAFPIQANLGEPNQVNALFSKVGELPFHLKVLVNSAAVLSAGDLRTMTPAEWDGIMALNLRAPWLCAQQAARLMQPGSVIVNITDSGSGRAWSGYPAYIISKTALDSLTRVLARALAPAIRVNGVAPGLVLPGEGSSPEEWQKLIARLPVKKSTAPESVAQAVLFLIQNEDITGQILAVDGGYQLL